MTSSIAGPITSGPKYGCDQPPCSKPASVSSSEPPGACTTPSTVMKSMRMMSKVCSFLVVLTRSVPRERAGDQLARWPVGADDHAAGRHLAVDELEAGRQGAVGE